jgi:hypothetical protein
MMIVAEHLAQLMEDGGYPCRISHHSVWENYSTPPMADLILELLPAYTEAEAGCPVINIRPLLTDLNHPQTIARVLEQVSALVARDVPPVVFVGGGSIHSMSCHS